jgi:putative phosphoesterase
MKLLILSDMHANWPALEAVLCAEPNHTAIAFCGDVVDYGPNPIECVRWVARNADFTVRGNHDNAVGFDLDCRCMGSFREYSLATRAWHKSILSEADLEFLRNMPTLYTFEWQGRHFRMAHATPQGDLFEYLPMAEWPERVKDLDEDFVLLGHTHIQGKQKVGRTTVVNPGSVGLARDTEGLACYATFDGEDLALKRIPYDVERTLRALRNSPLSRSVVEGLSVRLLPNKESVDSSVATDV